MAMKLASIGVGDGAPSRQRGRQMARIIYAGLRPFDWCGNNDDRRGVQAGRR